MTNQSLWVPGGVDRPRAGRPARRAQEAPDATTLNTDTHPPIDDQLRTAAQRWGASPRGGGAQLHPPPPPPRATPPNCGDTLRARWYRGTAAMRVCSRRRNGRWMVTTPRDWAIRSEAAHAAERSETRRRWVLHAAGVWCLRYSPLPPRKGWGPSMQRQHRSDGRKAET